MRNGATDRAAVTHLRIADVAGSMRQQRHVLGEHGALLDVHVAGQGTDGDVIAGITDVAEVLHSADVDEHGGLGQA